MCAILILVSMEVLVRWLIIPWDPETTNGNITVSVRSGIAAAFVKVSGTN